MITVLLRGGMGNQMFQYAAGLALAHKNKTRLLLDTTILADRFPRRQITFRNYDLDIFSLKPEFTALSRAAKAVPIPGAWVGIDLALIAARNIFGIQKLVKEKEEHVFDPTVMDAGANAFLWGFWQTPKYFAGAEKEIRDAFGFKHPLEGEAAAIAQRIKDSNSVALHVRRGDYLLSKYKDIYGGTNLAYYEKAIAYIAEKVKNPTCFVFSDDIKWCRENIKPPFPTVYITDASRGPKASFHLKLMSLCKHNIITNSTFSWWGAWLNVNPGKIIIAPKRWISIKKTQEDIIPADWVTF